MKIPVTPPDVLPLLSRTTPERLAEIVRGTSMLAAGRYLHWDNMRHRVPPDGFSHEEWWLGTRMARLSARETVPFSSKEGYPFSLVHAAPVRQGLHEIDQKLGMSGPRSEVRDLVEGHGSKHLLANSILEEAIRSSQLEGASTTRRVAKEMIRRGRQPRTHGERMILNNYHAMERIGELARRELNKADVFELHSILMDGTRDAAMAGRFRRASDDIVVTLVHSDETAHVPPAAAELPARMDRLVAFANDQTPEHWVHPVIRAILLHFMIGYDHPFVNGNGRVARSLFYWSMVRQGYSLAQYLAVSGILRNAPAKYARAYLHTETDGGDLTYFVDYHIGVIIRSIDALSSYVDRKMSDIRRIEDRLRHSPDLNHRQIQLLGHALRNPGFRYTVQSHGTSHGITPNTARADLVKLAAAGLLASTKRGRRQEFIATRDLEAALADYGKQVGSGRTPGEPTRSVK